MIFRGLKEADLEECLAIDPRSTGEVLVGRSVALEVWRDLMKHPAFHAAVIEAVTKDGVQRIVCFGASLFLAPEYADHLLREPKPDCNSRALAGIARAMRVICSEATLTEPGAADRLDLLLLCSSYKHEALQPDQQAEISMLLPQALVHLHAGYPIRRLLMETTSDAMHVLAESSGVWKTVALFPTEHRALMMVTKEEMRSAAGLSVLTPLFHYRAPVLGLRETEKHLLAEAVHGETDSELALRLHLSVSTVKKRWGSLFAHIAETRPEMLPEAPAAARHDARGMQKRHHILAYVRAHPEELRPFRSYPRT